MDDALTFLLAFASVFGGIAFLLLHLEGRAKALEARLATLEAVTAKAKGPAAPATSKP